MIEEEKHDPEDSDVIASQQKPTITVEVYDPSTNAFAFVREIPLYKDSSHKIFTIDENKIH